METTWRKHKQYLATAFFLWVTLLVPTFFENAYFNMLEAKGHIYAAGAIITLVAAAVLCAFARSAADFFS
jgi:hypothetical protein